MSKNWHTHLLYKRADGGISHCVPVHKDEAQKELTAIGSAAFLANIKSALAHEQDINNADGVNVLQKRLDWFHKVKDFNNLTDEEFMDFIHCATPDDHQYHHWISADKLENTNKTYRDAWCDIDENANVKYNLDKAKRIQMMRDIHENNLKNSDDEWQQKLASHPLRNKIITSIDQLQGLKDEKS